MSAVFAPVRSRMVLMATVEPCRNSPADRYSLPAFSTPLEMPSTSRSGVDSALPKVSRPVLSSNTAMSVKVPPISAARRMLAPLPAPGFVRTAIFFSCLELLRLLHCRLRDRSPARGFGLHERRKLVRRQRLRIEGVLDDAFLDLRQLQDSDRFLV